MTALNNPTQRDFLLSIARAGQAVIVRIAGELDMATAPQLRAVLVDLIDNQGNLDVAVDVSALSFVDSTGLGVLVGAHRKLQQRNGRLTVVSPTAATTRVLQITGLDRIMATSESSV